jgi:tRNA nucleotidyltransferase (CCA-adding enzyme)
LRVVFPEVDALFGIPQPAKWHPEIDAGLHTMMVVEQSATLSDEVEVRFAALVHDLGKATTNPAELPSHPGHEQRGSKLIRKMANRLPIPRNCRDLAILVAEYHTHCHRAFELRDSTVVRVLEKTDAFRRPQRFEQFLLSCEADAKGRTGLENRDYPQAAHLRFAFAAASAIDAANIANTSEEAQIADEIRQARVSAVSNVRARS